MIAGRVYTQMERMCRAYSRALLLVEPDGGGHQRRTPFTGETGRRALNTRALLCLLVRLCPQMRIVWTTTPMETADLIAQLKVSVPM